MTEPAARPPTIADVARLASVSVPTVSRVLTGSARVTPDKAARVTAAIAQLSYRPSAAARNLASGRADVIAVMTANTTRYGYAETIRGVEEAARAEGYTITITVLESTEERELDRVIASTLGQAVAGVAVLKFDPSGVAVLDRLPPGVPVVSLSGVRRRGALHAIIDEHRAADELTRYLLDLGHHTVHHVRFPPSRRIEERTRGWRDALERAGAPVPAMRDAEWTPASGREIGRSLAAEPGVTAVFCGNDELAMAVMRGLMDAGLRIPEDVSVVGFDDHPLAELWGPAITTAHQDLADLGRRGFRLLSAAIRGVDGPRFSSVRPELVIRSSAAAPNPDRVKSL